MYFPPLVLSIFNFVNVLFLCTVLKTQPICFIKKKKNLSIYKYIYILYLTSFKFRQVPAMNVLHNKFVKHLNKNSVSTKMYFLEKRNSS